MQEIIPSLEITWQYFCEKFNYNYHLLNVDTAPLSNDLKSILISDLIVVTCFNTKIAQYIKIIREQLNIDTRLFFYLHGLATVALWPLHRFHILHLLRSNDLFIATCEGDIKCMKLAFENGNTIKIPFTIDNHLLLEDFSIRDCPLVYIGRISPQKNIELLIKTYSLLDQKIKLQHPLIIYGSEDHLGFPNLGILENNYLSKLKILINELDLENYIFLRGFVDRIQIQEELGSNFVFISPSTHSDENFGMSCLRSLLAGATCVLSAWGGHLEFKKHFPDQIYYIKTQINSTGTQINLHDFKKSILSALANKKNGPKAIPSYFSFENTCHHLQEFLIHSEYNSQPLSPLPLALTVFKQQEFFEKNNKIQQCFNSFDDPAFISFFEAYSSDIV